MASSGTYIDRRWRLAAALCLAGLSGCADQAAGGAGDDSWPDDPQVVAFPRALLGESMLFGGAIVGISDPNDEALGDLKDARLTPINVRPVLADGGVLALMGCPSSCGDAPSSVQILAIPVVASDDQAVWIDLRGLGNHLDISAVLGADRFAVTVGASSTEPVPAAPDELLFDTVTEAEYSGAADGLHEFTLTARWFLLREGALDGNFEPRGPSTQVGYFGTYRRAQSAIQRLSIAQPTHYYVKNVPEEFHAAFEAAFADWNQVFLDAVGVAPLTYEFIAAGDPRAAQYVAGDARYFVMEWDLDNQAPWGGSGPALANQRTGQIFSATVLLQGPEIVEDYREWFAGRAQLAAARTPEQAHAARRRQVEAQRLRVARSLGRAQLRVSFAGLELQRDNGNPEFDTADYDSSFDEPPADQTFDTYMPGFFRELVAHELGHNIGLRHNFLGSLADDDQEVTSVSVMDYSWRVRRHKTKVGSYDAAAVAYGYAGTVPPSEVRYCTDEDLPTPVYDDRSAECSKRDGTSDPFSFFRERRLRRALDLGIGRDTPGMNPPWLFEDLREPFSIGLLGMTYYATSAEATSASWTNFQAGDPERPLAPAAIATYVLGEIRSVVCDVTIAEHINASYAIDAQAGVAAARTWNGLVDAAANVLSNAELNADLCSPAEELSFPF